MRFGWMVIGLGLMMAGCTTTSVTSVECRSDSGVCLQEGQASGREVYQEYYLPRSEIDISFAPSKAGAHGTLTVNSRTIPDPEQSFRLQYRRDYFVSDEFQLTVQNGLLTTSNNTNQTQSAEVAGFLTDLRDALEPAAPAAAPAAPSFSAADVAALFNALNGQSGAGTLNFFGGAEAGDNSRSTSDGNDAPDAPVLQRQRVLIVPGQTTCSRDALSPTGGCAVLVGFRLPEFKTTCDPSRVPAGAIEVSACDNHVRTYLDPAEGRSLWACLSTTASLPASANVCPRPASPPETGQRNSPHENAQNKEEDETDTEGVPDVEPEAESDTNSSSIYFRRAQPVRIYAHLADCAPVTTGNAQPTGCSAHTNPAEFSLIQRQFDVQIIDDSRHYGVNFPRSMTGANVTNFAFSQGVLTGVTIKRPGIVEQVLRSPLTLIGVLEATED